ncbi:hypothetical protein EDC01DRAFT_358478 [Geopyxis carbonaria]|nr:hypothetical protein EDC01DRAFT_358478 [Geopyxis carbonaria]
MPPLASDSAASPVSESSGSYDNSWYLNYSHRRNSSTSTATSHLPYVLSLPVDINFSPMYGFPYRQASENTNSIPISAVSAQMTPPESPTTASSTPIPSTVATSNAQTNTELNGPGDSFSPDEEKRLLSAAAVHKLSGNSLFSTHHYLAAIDAYDLALSTTPIYLARENSVLYSNIAACYLKLNEAESALKNAELAVKGRPGWAKALLRRARAREACGGWKELETAHGELVGVLEGMGEGGVPLEATLGDAEKLEISRGVERLQRRIDVVKKEEVGEVVKNLKTLGNGLLKPFGLSTEDFGLVKDERTGQYSMTFQRGGSDGASNAK